MPSTGQLIPNWRHPSETTFIYDNTKVADTENINVTSVRMLQVFASSKGIDNKLLNKNSVYRYVRDYGYPDYKRYGQPCYMPYTALGSGFADVWCMRVMPQDAAYANVMYAVKVKVAPEVSHEGTEPDPLNPGHNKKIIDSPAKLVVKFVPMTQENLNDGAMFASHMETLKDETPDGEGFVTYPYIGFRSLGRGVYGGNYRARVSHDVASDKNNDFKNYTIALISTENGTEQLESFPNVCFDEDATDPKTGETLYIEDKVNDFEGDGSKHFGVVFMPNYHKKIFELYKKEVDPNTTLTPASFDIFGYNRKTLAANPLVEVVDGISSVALMHTEGVVFANGSDGSLGDDKPEDKRKETLDKLYLEAYSGGLDPIILSKRRAPANVILDANYSSSVKKQLAALALKRYDAIAYLDSGLLTTVNACIANFTTYKDIDTYLVSKNAGMFTTKDPITNKNIPATITLWLAYKIPMHWRQYGMHTAMASEDVATLSGYVKNSVRPTIDADDDEIKEIFYDARWNYIECISENRYMRGTQQTSQTDLSDLSEENNVHVMLWVKNNLEALCRKKRYKMAEAADRKRFTDDAQELFSNYKGTYFRSIAITFSMNKFEEARSILHCHCAIVYNTLVKRSVIEIDINPRV